MFQLIKTIFLSLVTDRAVQAGGVTSGTSFLGGRMLAESSNLTVAQEWVALVAAIIGALTAAATLVYMVIKISRLLKNKDALG